MKTTEKMIAVMQAYADGKKIEVYNGMWVETDNPYWDWKDYDYRVKKEPKYRPYANAEECFKDVIKHGGWVKSEVEYFHINAVCNAFVLECTARNTVYNEIYEHLLKYNVWADDGSPCGVKEEEGEHRHLELEDGRFVEV